ncbi:low specificity L-threonine aldolase [Alphaproteobacteria bacterium KMM 3653]|uniref:Low specificity L-threonine aldolase n=1 Tax=Harenicola maris TaxID=2841044 RepID=A0AAP2CLN6_9RHOB|nr:low specificity L-threonine aldolase [Harenicola maris]
MHFASDNSGPAHPEVMESLLRANAGYAMPYGKSDLDAEAQGKLREVFEAPEAAVHFVATGTAANSIILATLCAPFETVFCSDVAHIHEDECNAPEFFSGGAKLTLVPHENGKITPEALRAVVSAEESRGVHGPQRGPVSITQASEKGTVYTLAEIRAISEVCREFGLPLHMDGARFANACARLGCTAAEMSWKSGVDALSFGGTKNGLMGVEAAVLFGPAKAWELELRRKRGAHLFSKNRYLSAQMLPYLSNDLWLHSAAKANERCAELTRGLSQIAGTRMAFQPEANILFAHLPRAVHKALHEAGAQYYLWSGELEGEDPREPLLARMVCDWSIPREKVAAFVDIARAADPG